MCSAPGDRTCRCCETGKPCAYELQLSARDESALARVLAIAGEQPQYRLTKTDKTSPWASHEPLEPVTAIECYDCERSTEMLTYLHDFLVTNHVKLPVCPVCAAARRAA